VVISASTTTADSASHHVVSISQTVPARRWTRALRPNR
jgi:hypothetical protein